MFATYAATLFILGIPPSSHVLHNMVHDLVDTYDCAQYTWLHNMDLGVDSVRRTITEQLLHPLSLSLAAFPEFRLNTGVLRIWLLRHSDNALSLEVLEEGLSVIIEAGADVNARSPEGYTASIITREKKCWNEWCRALQRNNMRIWEVLQEESNTWLLEENWPETWIKTFPDRPLDYRRYFTLPIELERDLVVSYRRAVMWERFLQAMRRIREFSFVSSTKVGCNMYLGLEI